jgi:hypothetical protein
MLFKSVAILSLCCATAAVAQQTTVQQSMTFDECVQSIQTSSAGSSQPPVTIVDNADTRQVQFAVPDGQVTITCTRALERATITHQ